MQLTAADPGEYLGSDDVVETTAPEVAHLAAGLRREAPDDVGFARAAFVWVRDNVAHSLDAADPRVTLTATEVLRERVGLCFAKSHLLVALLRSQGVPAGLCYQRLATETGHVVHGLVAVHLEGRWHRQDPRGNRAGADAQFRLGAERLAFVIDPEAGEVDYPVVRATPAPEVVAALSGATDALRLCDSGLPGSIA